MLKVGMLEMDRTSAYERARRNVVRVLRGAATSYTAEGCRNAREALTHSGRQGVESQALARDVILMCLRCHSDLTQKVSHVKMHPQSGGLIRRPESIFPVAPTAVRGVRVEEWLRLQFHIASVTVPPAYGRLCGRI